MAKKKNTVLYVILAILLPPLSAGLQKGIKKDFWINLILTICFYLPGIIHALWLTLK